jgi:hypothetical protein
MKKNNYEYWTNTWGDCDENGYYKQSFDYNEIVEGKL